MSARFRPRRLGGAALALIAAVALVGGAAAFAASPAAAKPNAFLHDVDRVNGHLRVAIEFAPEELGEALGTADVVCALGERAAAQGEAAEAAADWSTLSQLVDDFATGAAHRVDVAFANADGVLGDLRERYERRWAGDPRLGKLRQGVHSTRLGIRVMRRAIGGLSTPFAAWRAHECLAATEGVTTTFRRIPTGLRLIDLGMLELWRLAGLLPSPEEGT
jgi:hypothetical protein